MKDTIECVFEDFGIRRKEIRDRYYLMGRTLGPRSLKIIFQLTREKPQLFP